MAKALAKNPEDRYANCLDFIDYLQKATMKGGAAPAAPCRCRPIGRSRR